MNMAKKSRKNKKTKNKEEVCEVFDIGKKGKEKEKIVCDSIEKKPATKEQIQNQNKTLRNILIVIGVIIICIVLAIYFINSLKSFEYRGVKWTVVKEGSIIFYQTSFPIQVGAKSVPYSIYLRNDHRELDRQIPFNGEIFGKYDLSTFSDKMARLVINSTSKFDCNADEIIAVGNLASLQGIGIKMIRDTNASTTCDPQGRYIFINLKEAEKSEINQIGKSCYELNIANCEVLKVTERFMTELFVRYNEE